MATRIDAAAKVILSYLVRARIGEVDVWVEMQPRDERDSIYASMADDALRDLADAAAAATVAALDQTLG